MDIEKLGPKAVSRALEIIKRGGVVIFPTDTVYGFIANAENKKAVEKIFKIKKRLKSKPLAVFVKDIKMAKALAEINDKQEKILKKYWPGKYTFVLPSLRLSAKASAKEEGAEATRQSRKYIIKNNKIAIRIPDYKYLNILLKKINKPLIQTSVNISGQKPLLKSEEIIKQFKKSKNLLFVDVGNLSKREPSRVIDLTHDGLTRIR